MKCEYTLDKEGSGSKVRELVPSVEYKAKRRKTVRVRAAAAVYLASAAEEAMSTISSKNQITLPAHLLRELGIGPGDRLAVSRDGARLVLRARPKDWVKYHAGSLAGLYGRNAREADAYVRELRDEWAEDEEAQPDAGTPSQN
jgi:AbrB family looped-hinge helix DNA binding protein